MPFAHIAMTTVGSVRWNFSCFLDDFANLQILNILLSSHSFRNSLRFFLPCESLRILILARRLSINKQNETPRTSLFRQILQNRLKTHQILINIITPKLSFRSHLGVVSISIKFSKRSSCPLRHHISKAANSVKHLTNFRNFANAFALHLNWIPPKIWRMFVYLWVNYWLILLPISDPSTRPSCTYTLTRIHTQTHTHVHTKQTTLDAIPQWKSIYENFYLLVITNRKPIPPVPAPPIRLVHHLENMLVVSSTNFRHLIRNQQQNFVNISMVSSSGCWSSCCRVVFIVIVVVVFVVIMIVIKVISRNNRKVC